MIFQETKDLIVEYVRQCAGKATKNGVAKYIYSKKVDKLHRISRITTLAVIKELAASGRIKILKGAKPGQSDYLIVDPKSQFDHLAGQFTNIESMLGQHPEAENRLTNLVIINLARVDKYIKNENDRQYLNQKGLDLLLKIRYKTKNDGLASEV